MLMHSLITLGSTVKPAYVVTCIKRSHFPWPVTENVMWIEPLLRGYLSYFISVGTNIPECRPKGLNSYGAADLQCIKNMIYFPYSQTCIKRPLLGPRKNGLIRQVTS
jgi:hypothetical protein